MLEERNSISTIADRFSHIFNESGGNLVVSRSIKIFSLKRTVGRRVTSDSYQD